MITQSNQRSYLFSCIASISIHIIILSLLLCGLYSAHHQDMQESPKVLDTRQGTVLFRPLLSNALAPSPSNATVSAGAQSQQQSSSSALAAAATQAESDAAIDDAAQDNADSSSSSAMQQTSEISSAPTMQEDLSSSRALTSLALPDTLPHDGYARTQQTTSIPSSPSSSRARWRRTYDPQATQQLAGLTNRIVERVENAQAVVRDRIASTHKAQNDVHNSIERDYYTRVWRLMQKAGFSKTPILCAQATSTLATFVLTIDSDGSYKEAHLNCLEQNKDLKNIELMLVALARRVGHFPRVPPSFKVDTLTMRMPIRIRTHQGLHSYDLVYD